MIGKLPLCQCIDSDKIHAENVDTREKKKVKISFSVIFSARNSYFFDQKVFENFFCSACMLMLNGTNDLRVFDKFCGEEGLERGF